MASLSGDDFKYVLKKATSFSVLNEWETKFLRSVANQKKVGKILTDKQIGRLIPLLQKLADKNIIARDSIDNDQEICGRILDSLEKS